MSLLKTTGIGECIICRNELNINNIASADLFDCDHIEYCKKCVQQISTCSMCRTPKNIPKPIIDNVHSINEPSSNNNELSNSSTIDINQREFLSNYLSQPSSNNNELSNSSTIDIQQLSNSSIIDIQPKSNTRSDDFHYRHSMYLESRYEPEHEKNYKYHKILYIIIIIIIYVFGLIPWNMGQAYTNGKIYNKIYDIYTNQEIDCKYNSLIESFKNECMYLNFSTFLINEFRQIDDNMNYMYSKNDFKNECKESDSYYMTSLCKKDDPEKKFCQLALYNSLKNSPIYKMYYGNIVFNTTTDEYDCEYYNFFPMLIFTGVSIVSLWLSIPLFCPGQSFQI